MLLRGVVRSFVGEKGVINLASLQTNGGMTRETSFHAVLCMIA